MGKEGDRYMPMYSFKCKKCGGNTDTINSLAEHDKPPGKCEATEGCDSSDGFELTIGSTQFILKGYGWARDGYNG